MYTSVFQRIITESWQLHTHLESATGIEGIWSSRNSWGRPYI